jgi:hypothetical protein
MKSSIKIKHQGLFDSYYKFETERNKGNREFVQSDRYYWFFPLLN